MESPQAEVKTPAGCNGTNNDLNDNFLKCGVLRHVHILSWIMSWRKRKIKQQQKKSSNQQDENKTMKPKKS